MPDWVTELLDKEGEKLAPMLTIDLNPFIIRVIRGYHFPCGHFSVANATLAQSIHPQCGQRQPSVHSEQIERRRTYSSLDTHASPLLPQRNIAFAKSDAICKSVGFCFGFCSVIIGFAGGTMICFCGSTK